MRHTTTTTPPSSRILTTTSGVDKVAERSDLKRRCEQALSGVRRQFDTLRSKAVTTSTTFNYWNDPVFHELEELKEGLRPEQQDVYEGVRYHVFHSTLQMERRPIGRYDDGSSHSIPERTDYPRHLVPSLEDYGYALNWLLGVEPSRSGRSHVMGICLLEKGLHLINTKVRYFDHHVDWGRTDNMYNVLQNLIWNAEILRSRYTLSRDGTGPYLGLNPHGAVEVNLYG